MYLDFDTILFTLGTRDISLSIALFAVGGLIAAFFLLKLIFTWRAATRRAKRDAYEFERNRVMEQRLSEVVAVQSQMAGRMQTIAEVFGTRQSDLNKSIGERMDQMTDRLGRSMVDSTKSTHENLKALGERLAVIDKAQMNITDLSSQVVELQSILANKQTRGAFGQARMETIVADALPSSAYSFQATLGNGTRPDCMIHMPNDAPSLVVDAKFPLEAWNRIRAAEHPSDVKLARDQFQRDMDVHIKAIRDKYFLPGETQDTAFLFVPSESIFADIHEHFEAIVQKAHRARVVIVSPSLLMLSIQVVQSVLKDQRMREQAHIIQKEVVMLLDDVGRLDERVRKLQGHFGQTAKDVDHILTSTRKVTARSQKIEAMEFEDQVEVPRNGRVIPIQRDLLKGE